MELSSVNKVQVSSTFYSLLFLCSYVSRKNFLDSTKHCILGTQQFRPRELASQMNLSMDNGWGIIRCIVDYCMSLSDGKYLILKDPNKASFFAYYEKCL